MNLSYTWEKLYLGVLSMAEGYETLPRRLEVAFSSQIMRLSAEDFPPDLRVDFERLVHLLTHRPARNESEGTIRATCDQMSREEAEEAGRLVVKLYDQIGSQVD